MPRGYGTYCPVSLAAEIVGERWTIPLLLVLCDDARLRFNEMRRALPRIPPSTPVQRLRSLEDAGGRIAPNFRKLGLSLTINAAGESATNIITTRA
jgi:DNA-binding HxlR family transcriptional regulator